SLFDCNDRPVANERIVNAEKFMAPPMGWTKGMRYMAQLFHSSEYGRRLNAVAFFHSTMPQVQNSCIFPADSTPASGKAAAVFFEKRLGLMEKKGFSAQLWIVKIWKLKDYTFHKLGGGPLNQSFIVIESTGYNLASKPF